MSKITREPCITGTLNRVSSIDARLSESRKYDIIKAEKNIRNEMMEKHKTEIAKSVEHSGSDIRYDAQVKNVLANKWILAWILKTCTEEFSNIAIKDIVDCIENPSVGE